MRFRFQKDSTKDQNAVKDVNNEPKVQVVENKEVPVDVQNPQASKVTELKKPQVTLNSVPFFDKGGKATVKVITIGGTSAVTKNMTVYESGDDMIVVDCGIGFPDSEMLGVDVVLPDITYILENKHKLKALFISHGHEDHIGAIPYVIKDLDVPIYCTRLVQGLIQVKLREKSLLDGVKIKVVDPDKDNSIIVGSFKVDYFRTNHSIPDSCGLAIKTPQGTILHCADFKFDWTPVLDKPFDVAKMTRLAENGVKLLLSDCLGATTEGYAKSERTIETSFDELFGKAAGKQVFLTTVSSNVSRMAQAISSAVKHGRRVVLLGRSIDQVTDVSMKLGYLPFSPSVFVDREKARKENQAELLYIVAGAYGQSESAISRISRGEHRDVTLEDGAYVIFSADPNPPGVRDDVDNLINRLTLKNSIVIYSEIQENLHVSGHGLRGDLKLMAALAKPNYFMPIGGTVKHMRAYANMVSEMGYQRDTIFELLEGESLLLHDGVIEQGGTVLVTNVYVDGSKVGDIGEKVIEDRNILAESGIVVAVIGLDSEKEAKKIEIVTRGFIYVKESKELIDNATNIVRNSFNQNKKDLGDSRGALKGKIEQALSKFLFKQTGREPYVLVSLIEV